MKVKEAREVCEKWTRLYQDLNRLETMATEDADGEELAKEVEEQAGTASTFVNIMHIAKAVVGSHLDALKDKIDNSEVDWEA